MSSETSRHKGNTKMRKGLLAAAVLGGTLFFYSDVKASVVYSYVTDQPSYTAAPGGTVTVQIFLKETVTGTDTSIITADGGMFTAGFSVNQSPTNLPANPAGIFSIAGNAAFDGGFTKRPGDNANNTYATSRAGDDATSPSDTSGPLPSGGLIPLGTVTIQAGTSGTTTFVAGNFTYPSKGGGYTLDQSGNDLDTNSTAPAYTGAANNPETFTVAVTPEPGSLGLLGLAALGLASRRRSALNA